MEDTIIKIQQFIDEVKELKSQNEKLKKLLEPLVRATWRFPHSIEFSQDEYWNKFLEVNEIK